MLKLVDRALTAAREGRLAFAINRRVAEVLGRDIEQPYRDADPRRTTLTFEGETKDAYAAAIFRAVVDGQNGIGKLSEEVRALKGMSGKAYRLAVNNLVASVEGARYLEVGSWLGSTAASATYGNDVTCICIDNWAEFGGTASAFLDNMKKAIDPARLTFMERDFRKVDYTTLPPSNVYLFDGPHTFRDHYDGIRLAQPALDEKYILIIDDWNWLAVRMGTFAALKKLGSEILYKVEVRTSHDDQMPEVAFEASEWHNGYLFAVVRKKR